jgi:ABC-type antimicrobial peptide transport system ATPase subunit
MAPGKNQKLEKKIIRFFLANTSLNPKFLNLNAFLKFPFSRATQLNNHETILEGKPP